MCWYYQGRKSLQPSGNICREHSSHLVAKMKIWLLLPHVSYVSLWWHCVTKPFLKCYSITVTMAQGSYKCLGSGCQTKRRKQRHTCVRWWDVSKTKSRYPKGRIRMQGAGSEDIVSLDPLHIKTEVCRDLLILVQTYSAGVFACIYLRSYKEEFPWLFKFKFFENNRKCWSLAIKCITIKKICWLNHTGNWILC